MPLSGATATAVDACCPHLSALRIEHEKKHPPPEWEVQLTTNIGYQLGCIQLLALCGPRLRELRLLGVHRWQALSYMALNRCTALVSLELEAGWRPARYLRQDDEDFVPEQYLGGAVKGPCMCPHGPRGDGPDPWSRKCYPAACVHECWRVGPLREA